MSTKNLARTVIEGGRAQRNTFDRRTSNSAHRRGVRQELTRERKNAEYGEVVYPRRKSVPQANARGFAICRSSFNKNKTRCAVSNSRPS